MRTLVWSFKCIGPWKARELAPSGILGNNLVRRLATDQGRKQA